MIESGVTDTFKDPQMLNAMESIERYMKQEHAKWVVDGFSIINLVRDTFQQFNEGKKDMYVIPQEQAMLSQIILLIENGNPDDRRKLVTDDFATARFSISLRDPGSRQAAILAGQIQEQLDQYS